MITRDISFTVKDQNDVAVADAIVTVILNRTDYDADADEWIYQVQQTLRTNANGEVVVTLWPNDRGTKGSVYRVTTTTHDGRIIFDRYARLEDIDGQDFYGNSWPVSQDLSPSGGGGSIDEQALRAYADYVANQARLNAIAAANLYTLSEINNISLSVSWDDIDDQPTIPTNNNQLTNGAGYITEVAAKGYTDGKISGLGLAARTNQYSDLDGLPVIPTKTSQLENDSSFTTSTQANNYTDLKINQLATVAASGMFADLIGVPTIPTDNAQIANGRGFVTLAEVNTFIAGQNNLAVVAVTGQYSDLIGLPTLGTASEEDVAYFATAAQGTLAENAIPIIQKGSANGVATLDALSKVPSAQLPDAAFIKVYIVADENTQLSLNATEGDICIRTDLGRSTYIRNNQSNGTMADWEAIGTGVGDAPFDSNAYARKDGDWEQLGSVAMSNDFDDIDNKPFIPENTADLTNDAGFITSDINWIVVDNNGITLNQSHNGAYLLVTDDCTITIDDDNGDEDEEILEGWNVAIVPDDDKDNTQHAINLAFTGNGDTIGGLRTVKGVCSVALTPVDDLYCTAGSIE